MTVSEVDPSVFNTGNQVVNQTRLGHAAAAVAAVEWHERKELQCDDARLVTRRGYRSRPRKMITCSCFFFIFILVLLYPQQANVILASTPSCVWYTGESSTIPLCVTPGQVTSLNTPEAKAAAVCSGQTGNGQTACETTTVASPVTGATEINATTCVLYTIAVPTSTVPLCLTQQQKQDMEHSSAVQEAAICSQRTSEGEVACTSTSYDVNPPSDNDTARIAMIKICTWYPLRHVSSTAVGAVTALCVTEEQAANMNTPAGVAAQLCSSRQAGGEAECVGPSSRAAARSRTPSSERSALAAVEMLMLTMIMVLAHCRPWTLTDSASRVKL
ncbi:unnamed protein product [Amoebophrya sp. A120]|nr:unnamed protein product [Amoebophrya sp. A120]|eukprot:GSA120T00011962001.1